jgi:hypothetical protein
LWGQSFTSPLGDPEISMTTDVREQGQGLRQLLLGCVVLLFGVGSFIGGQFLFGTSGEGEHAQQSSREPSKPESKTTDLPAEVPTKADEKLRKAAQGLVQAGEAQHKATGSPPAGELALFKSVEGQFSVLMPGTPKKQNLNASGISTTAYAIEEKEGAYVVVFADMPIPARESAMQTQLRLEGARDGMLMSTNARLTSEGPLLLAGKYPGREMNADLPERKGILRARLYVVGQRLYQIMVAGRATWARTSQADQFLDSLAVTADKPPSTTNSSATRKQRSATR